MLTEVEKERLDTLVGKSLDEVDTPALIVDLDIMEENMDKMMKFLQQGTVGLRPHAKTHKTPPIARIQMEKGAVGITCAKLGEAEVLADGGINDILITNRVVSRNAIKRAVSLSKKINLKIAVDSEENVRDLSQAAVIEGTHIEILIEVDPGNKRSGVRTETDAVKLARLVASLPGLKFSGIMGYEGHCVFIKDLEKRKKEARIAYARLFEFKDALEKAGMPPGIISCGGTGTYLLAGMYDGITDIQPGSYIFMDGRYASIEGIDFKQSLTVLSTIVSHPEPDLYICDAGLKSMSAEFGLASTFPSYGLKVLAMSEEYVKLTPTRAKEENVPLGWLDLDKKYAQNSGTLKLGSRIHLIPSHCCTTVNLHDVIYGVRNGIVQSVWRVAGRGRFA